MNKEEASRWLKSLVITLIIFSLFSLYLFLRRGYFDLYIANKVFGGAAAIIAGITLAVGPLSKHYILFSKIMTIRRHMGLLAFALATIHAVLSILFLPNKFPIDWYIKEWLPITFGVSAVSVWVYMTYISRNSKIKELGTETWEKKLSIAGQIAFVLIFLHLTVMKTEGWLNWWQGQIKQTPELTNPSYPPASLFVLLVITAVILYRIYIRLRKKPISPEDALHAPQPADGLKIN